MLDISWGEIMVLGVVGAAVTGRKDLPAACRIVGTQLGRVVGLLQGARVRADQFAAHNELNQLQNELRSGLRELDQVRMELAVAASSQGMVGRNLGATTASANRTRTAVAAVSSGATTTTATTAHQWNASTLASSPINMAPMKSIASAPLHVTPTTSNPLTSSGLDTGQLSREGASIPSTPAAHSERAVLEEEWEKQGIGFQTRAEQLQRSKTSLTGNPSGSELLESLIKQNLTWDQYDRVVGEQDQHLQDRIAIMKEKRKASGMELPIHPI